MNSSYSSYLDVCLREKGWSDPDLNQELDFRIIPKNAIFIAKSGRDGPAAYVAEHSLPQDELAIFSRLSSNLSQAYSREELSGLCFAKERLENPNFRTHVHSEDINGRIVLRLFSNSKNHQTCVIAFLLHETDSYVVWEIGCFGASHKDSCRDFVEAVKIILIAGRP